MVTPGVFRFYIMAITDSMVVAFKEVNVNMHLQCSVITAAPLFNLNFV
jgi:hypothetical protein